MQHLVYFHNENVYTIISPDTSKWAGKHYENISLWNGYFKADVAEGKSLED